MGRLGKNQKFCRWCGQPIHWVKPLSTKYDGNGWVHSEPGAWLYCWRKLRPLISGHAKPRPA